MPYDVAPTCDITTQPYGCCGNSAEWYDTVRCPQLHYFHAGVDLSRAGGSCGQTVYATRAGVCAAVGIPSRAALGDRAVRLDVGGSMSVLYGHLEVALVSPGQPVKPGTPVGQIGTRGASTGCHLHLEVRTTASVASGQLNGVVDPTPWLMKAIGEPMSQQEVAAFVEALYYAIGVNAFPLAGESVAAYQARIGNDLDHQVQAVMSGSASLHDVTTNILKTHPH